MSINLTNTLSTQPNAYELRQLIRQGKFIDNTSGYAQGCVQGNIVILPKDWANDFFYSFVSLIQNLAR